MTSPLLMLPWPRQGWLRRATAELRLAKTREARPCLCMFHYVSINSIYRLVPGPGTTYDGVGGWGGMLTFMWTCRSSWCYAHAGWGGGDGVGWGGMLTFMWTCRSSWCYAHAGWGGGGMGWDVNVQVWTCRSSWCYAHAGWGGMLTFMWTCRGGS